MDRGARGLGVCETDDPLYLSLNKIGKGVMLNKVSKVSCDVLPKKGSLR